MSSKPWVITRGTRAIISARGHLEMALHRSARGQADDGLGPDVQRSRRQRLLFLWRSLLPGGVEQTALTLIEHLSDPDWTFFLGLLEPRDSTTQWLRGHRRLLFPPGGPRTDRQTEDLLFALKTPPRIGQYVCRAQALLNRVRPRILFTHSGVDILVTGALLRRRRTIWIARVESDAWEHAAGWQWWGRGPSRQLLRIAYRQPDHVIAASTGLRRRLVEDVGVPSQRVTVLPNPVDVARVQRHAAEPVAEMPQGPFLLAVGRLTPVKGFDVLVRTMALLRSEGWALPLVILGAGEELGPLRQLAEQLKVTDLVQLRGYDPNPWRWMRRAMALVVPSYQEGFSHVIVEALACGIPVVSTDGHGPRDILTPDLTAALVPPGQAGALAQAIRAVPRDPSVRQRGRARAEQRARAYAAGQVCRQYVALFRTLAGDPA